MPIYEYYDCSGWDTEEDILERNVPIEERDRQCCRRCGMKLKRVISFTGTVYAPTAGGMR